MIRGSNTFLLSLSLFVTCSCWYLLDGGIVETGGDAVSKWKDIKDYFNSSTIPSMDHHSLRWSVNIPMLLTMWLFNSDSPILYHVLMSLLGGSVSVVLFKIIYQKDMPLYPTLGLLLIVIGFAISNLNERVYTQFLPSGFLIFYMLTAFYFVKKAFEESFNRGIYFFLSGVFCFLAYGAKLTSIWFVIPFFSYIAISLIRNGEVKSLLYFSLPFFIGFIIEMIVVYRLTDYPLGRAFYVFSANDAHGRSLSNIESIHAEAGFSNFSEYLLSPLKYYIAYGKYSIIIYGAVLLSALRLIFLNETIFNRILFITVICFFVLQSYVIIGIEPYIYPEYYTIHRYQYPLMVLSFLVFFISFYDFVDKVKINCLSLIFPLFFFLSSSIYFSRDNANYGFLTTYSHDLMLNNWAKKEGAAFGYKMDKVESLGRLDVSVSISELKFESITKFYVESLYGVKYCNYKNTYIYEGKKYLYAFCDKWSQNSTVLLYRPQAYEFFHAKQLNYLGRFSELHAGY